MPRSIAIVILAIIVSPFGIRCYAGERTAEVPACLPSALDVYALPPSTSSPVPSSHLLVFEVQNIGKIVCSIDSPAVQLVPKLGQGDQFGSYKYLPDGSSTDGWFDETVLSPGDWVHTLVFWHSRGYPNSQCNEHSGLSFLLIHEDRGSVPVTKTSVEVRNLRMRSCILVLLSQYLKGRYSADSTIPNHWLRTPDASPGEEPSIPAQATDHQILHNQSLLQLNSSSNRILLGEFILLGLKGADQADNGCDFRILRKRESDGTTVISFQNCEESMATKDAPQLQQQSAGLVQTWISPLELGMLPTHPGPVAYDVVSDLGTAAAPSWAEAHIDLLAHDPTRPAQAAILNPLPDCTESQLKFASLPPLIAIPGTTLQAYEATNVSTQACSVAGVPAIYINQADMKACPNCANSLFAPRPNGRIDLQPGQIAHFLAGTEFHSEDGNYRSECQLVDAFDVDGFAFRKSLALPFVGGACGTLDVSAWREGRYDNDPLNIQWAKAHPPSADPTTPIPPDCNKPELLSKGRPIMIPMTKDLDFGLSLAQHEFKAGEGVTLHVWIDNRASDPAGVWTCMGLDYFKARGFDLYDAYGHRVFRRNEVKIQEKCKKDPDLANAEQQSWSCSRNFPINIPAHTCVAGDDYDFTTDLTASYDLPPGEYTVRPSQDKAKDVCMPQKERPFHSEPGKDLTFSVVQP